MRVLHVCSEVFPLLKTGGLADVSAALPPALAKLGCDGRMLLPGFPAIMAGVKNQTLLIELPPKFGASSIKIFLGTIPDTKISAYVIDAPGLYDRDGNPYSDSQHQPYADNYKRFSLLAHLAARIADGLDSKWQPQVVHGHDWHAGLTAAYLQSTEMATGRKLAGSVFTVHNLAYQGVFPRHTFDELGLPGQFFDVNGLEFYGQTSFMKAGLFFSDKITTVSPTYAREIQGPEQGCGLNGLLTGRQHDLSGILNGVDPDVWNPAKDKFIPATYTKTALAGKLTSKTALQKQVGLKVQTDMPLFSIVSRLTEQKGLNLVIEGLPELIRQGGQIVVLGNGDTAIEEAFKEAAKTYPEQVAVQIGFDEEQAHRIIAGSDVTMVPSRFEPCGLTQLYGLMYGTLPLVRRVGGLADTVKDCSLENMYEGIATGFVFEHFDIESFNAAVRRAYVLFKLKNEWKKVQQTGMQQNFSWENAAKQFLHLYKQVSL